MLTIPASGAPSASPDGPSKGGAVVAEKISSTHVLPTVVRGDNLECINGTNDEMDKDLEGCQEHVKACEESINGGAMQELLREPRFETVYSNGLDLGKFWMDNNIDSATKLDTPKEILLRVFLPEVMNASEVELDVSDTQALLVVPGLYKLQVKWRYVVESTKGSAKFDKVDHKLEVLLPTRAASAGPT